MPKPVRIEPEPGQESVWDYPRPPKIEDSTRHVEVLFEGVRVAESRRAKRVLETSSPPVYYIPPEDVRLDLLQQNERATVCEWKGQASYYNLTVGGRTSANAAWTYLRPTDAFQSIKAYIAFYAGRVDSCLLDGELVHPQPGDYYGGWVTREIVGPFKGEAGTLGW